MMMMVGPVLLLVTVTVIALEIALPVTVAASVLFLVLVPLVIVATLVTVVATPTSGADALHGLGTVAVVLAPGEETATPPVIVIPVVILIEVIATAIVGFVSVALAVLVTLPPT